MNGLSGEYRLPSDGQSTVRIDYKMSVVLVSMDLLAVSETSQGGV